MTLATAWCDTCKFFDELTEGNRLGRCRRSNPVPYVAGIVNPNSPYKIEAATAWPIVAKDDWCGEHIARTDRLEDVQGVYDGRV